MRKGFMVLVFGLMLLLVGCSNEQLKDAIESCKGDSECYEIVDSAIEEELASRGITGGKMNNKELERVYTLIEVYTFDESLYGTDDERSFQGHILSSYVGHLQNFGFSLEDIQKFDVAVAFFSGSNVNQMLEFKNANVDNLQYLIENGVKYVLYKESNNRFVLEVSGSELTTFTFDIDLDRVYLDSTALSPMSYINDMYNKIYNQDKLKLFTTEGHAAYCYQSDSETEYLICEATGQDGMFIMFDIQYDTFDLDGQSTNGYSITFNYELFTESNGSLSFSFTSYTGDISGMLSNVVSLDGFYSDENSSFDTEDFDSFIQSLNYITEMQIDIPERD